MSCCLYISNNHILLDYFFRSKSGLNRNIDWPFVLVKLEMNLSILEYLKFDSFLSMSQSNFG